MSLASKLKDLRIRSGQSLQQVADGVGVSKAHIWELESGKSTNPGVELLRRLAEHFKVTVGFLAGDAQMTDDSAALQFFREVEGLSEGDLKALREMAARLKGKP